MMPTRSGLIEAGYCPDCQSAWLISIEQVCDMNEGLLASLVAEFREVHGCHRGFRALTMDELKRTAERRPVLAGPKGPLP